MISPTFPSFIAESDSSKKGSDGSVLGKGNSAGAKGTPFSGFLRSKQGQEHKSQESLPGDASEPIKTETSRTEAKKRTEFDQAGVSRSVHTGDASVDGKAPNLTNSERDLGRESLNKTNSIELSEGAQAKCVKKSAEASNQKKEIVLEDQEDVTAGQSSELIARKVNKGESSDKDFRITQTGVKGSANEDHLSKASKDNTSVPTLNKESRNSDSAKAIKTDKPIPVVRQLVSSSTIPGKRHLDGEETERRKGAKEQGQSKTERIVSIPTLSSRPKRGENVGTKLAGVKFERPGLNDQTRIVEGRLIEKGAKPATRVSGPAQATDFLKTAEPKTNPTLPNSIVRKRAVVSLGRPSKTEGNENRKSNESLKTIEINSSPYQSKSGVVNRIAFDHNVGQKNETPKSISSGTSKSKSNTAVRRIVSGEVVEPVRVPAKPLAEKPLQKDSHAPAGLSAKKKEVRVASLVSDTRIEAAVLESRNAGRSVTAPHTSKSQKNGIYPSVKVGRNDSSKVSTRLYSPPEDEPSISNQVVRNAPSISRETLQSGSTVDAKMMQREAKLGSNPIHTVENRSVKIVSSREGLTNEAKKMPKGLVLPSKTGEAFLASTRSSVQEKLIAGSLIEKPVVKTVSGFTVSPQLIEAGGEAKIVSRLAHPKKINTQSQSDGSPSKGLHGKTQGSSQGVESRSSGADLRGNKLKRAQIIADQLVGVSRIINSTAAKKPVAKQGHLAKRVATVERPVKQPMGKQANVAIGQVKSETGGMEAAFRVDDMMLAHEKELSGKPQKQNMFFGEQLGYRKPTENPKNVASDSTVKPTQVEPQSNREVAVRSDLVHRLSQQTGSDLESIQGKLTQPRGQSVSTAVMYREIMSAVETFRAMSNTRWSMNLEPIENLRMQLDLRMADSQLVIQARVDRTGHALLQSGWGELQQLLSDKEVDLKSLTTHSQKDGAGAKFENQGGRQSGEQNEKEESWLSRELAELLAEFENESQQPRKATRRNRKPRMADATFETWA